MTVYFEILPQKIISPVNEKPITIALKYKEQSKNYIQWHNPVIREVPFTEKNASWRFGASVTLLGMLLEHSEYVHDGDFKMVKKIARSTKKSFPSDMYNDYMQLLRLNKKINR